MKFANPYWSKAEKASMLQRWIAVHSFLYYELNENVVSDRSFDDNCNQLVKLLDSMTEEEKKRTRLWYAFFDFEGSTGFHLSGRLTECDREVVERDANFLLFLKKKKRKR